MNFIDHGPLNGKTTVDNSSALTPGQRLTIIRQQRTLKRMDDSRFRDAVRLASRADLVLRGQETALEQLHRESIQPSITARGAITEINKACRVTGNRSGIIVV